MLNCAHLDDEREGRRLVADRASPATRSTTRRSPARRSPPSDAPGSAAPMTAQPCRLSPMPGSPAPASPSSRLRPAAIPACMRCSSAPFALRDGIDADALKARLISFAARRKPVETGPLTLARAGRYLVLRPVEPTPLLDWLAAQCVAPFDGFRRAARPTPTAQSMRAPTSTTISACCWRASAIRTC